MIMRPSVGATLAALAGCGGSDTPAAPGGEPIPVQPLDDLPGGTLDATSSSLQSSEGHYVLRGCGIGPLVLDGRISGRVRGPEREIAGEVPPEPSDEFTAFSIRDSRDDSLISLDVDTGF